MPRCRFMVDRITQESEPQTFKAGEVYDLSRASVDRWVRRGVAVEVEDEKPKPKRSKSDAGKGDD